MYPEREALVETGRSLTLGGDGIAVARASRSRRDGNRTFLELHHLVATSQGVEHLVDHHTLMLFTVDEYEAAFRAAGLAVERVPSPIRDRDRYIGVKPT